MYLNFMLVFNLTMLYFQKASKIIKIFKYTFWLVLFVKKLFDKKIYFLIKFN